MNPTVIAMPSPVTSVVNSIRQTVIAIEFDIRVLFAEQVLPRPQIVRTIATALLMATEYIDSASFRQLCHMQIFGIPFALLTHVGNRRVWVTRKAKTFPRISSSGFSDR